MNIFEYFVKVGIDDSDYKKGMKGIKSDSESSLGGIGKLFTNLGKIGVEALAATTAALTAFAGASVKTGMEFDKSMSQVAATLGLTMGELETQVGQVDLAWGTFTGNLREYAQEMGANTAFSATQCADALNYMALAGYDVQTSMEMLPNVLNLAAAGAMDLATASDMVTDTQTAFGISLERTNQMVDEMAKAASTGNTSVQQLGDAFLVVGGLAQELNGGIVYLSDGTTQAVDGLQELEIALTGMANAGIKGSEAGTHMRNMIMKLSSPTDKGAEAMERLGVNVFDAEGNMRSLAEIFNDLNIGLSTLSQGDKLTAISEIFNARDIASAESLLNAIDQDWDKIGESILDADGAAQQMADTQLDNLAGDITLFQSALEGLKIAISDMATPALRDFVQIGTEGLTNITNALKEGGLEAGVEAASDTIQKLADKLVNMSPVMIKAAFELLGNLAKGFIENAPMLVQTGIDLLLDLIDGLVEGLPQAIPMIVDCVMQITGILLDNADKLIEAGIALIEALLDGMIAAEPQFIDQMPHLVAKLVKALVKAAVALTKAMFEISKKMVVNFVKNIPEYLNAGKKIIIAIISGVEALRQKYIEVGKNIVAGIWSGIVGYASWFKNKLTSWVGDVVSFIKKMFKIASPSKVMRDEIGKNLALGVWAGWDMIDPFDKIDKEISSFDMTVATPNYNVGNSSDDSIIDYSAMADAMMYAMKQSGFVVELNNREVGRLVRKVVQV
jgi:TP901 family phage tail tape measure protein